MAVSRGPGSFTGLRVGMVCAKTFAYATRCRFVAVDTFAAIAGETDRGNIDRVIVIEDAQRDDLFAGEFMRNEPQRWAPASPIRVISKSDFLRDRTESDIVTGPGLRKLNPSEIPAHWLSHEDFCRSRFNDREVGVDSNRIEFHRVELYWIPTSGRHYRSIFDKVPPKKSERLPSREELGCARC